MKLMTITTSAQTLDSMPTDRPERIVVAGPVRVDLTISLTGGLLGRGEVRGQRVEGHRQAHADRRSAWPAASRARRRRPAGTRRRSC